MQINENSPIFWVDFNSLVLDGSIVFFLTNDNIKKNIFDKEMLIYEGMKVVVYMDDINNFDEKDKLTSSGYIIKNPIPAHRVKWCCKMQTKIAYELEDGNSIEYLLSQINNI